VKSHSLEKKKKSEKVIFIRAFVRAVATFITSNERNKMEKGTYF